MFEWKEKVLYLNEDVAAQCNQLAQVYPFTAVHVIGLSVMGKPLIALRCGNGSKLIHINGAFHGNEWITSALLMRFMNELCAAYAGAGSMEERQIEHLCNEVTIWAVPMVNPDGAELAQCGVHPQHPLYNELLQWNEGSQNFAGWKANIRGVDLNDQFPAFWQEECERRGVTQPSPQDYPGPYPLSEPEAAAIALLTDRIPFYSVAALHTQGREIYWNYRGFEPPQSEAMAQRLGEASGYDPIKLSGSDAGYKDWFIKKYSRPGFTVEAGFGQTPLPLEQFEDIYSELKPLLLELIQL